MEKSQTHASQTAAADNAGANMEAELIYGDVSMFGIYQIKDGKDPSHNFRFAPLRELESIGLSEDNGNYELVYTAPFPERIDPLSDRYPLLNKIHRDFNVDIPAGYTSRSVSVSDVIVLNCNGGIYSYFVDSAGFVELDNYDFFSEETQIAQLPEASPPERETDKNDALSRIGARQERRTGASVAEPEADTKLSKPISPLALTKTLKEKSKQNKGRTSAPWGKPTLMERLAAGKQKAVQQGQHDAHKKKERASRA